VPRAIVVKAAFDPDARVFHVEYSDLPGLNLEAETFEELRDKLPGAVADLLEAAGKQDEGEVPIELIARAYTRARFGAAV
jgi:hypothetical protein